jgi:hypothetical protein
VRGSYHILGNIDTKPINDLLERYDDWDNQYTRDRIKAYEVHTDTMVIPLQWSFESLGDPQLIAPKTEFYDKYYIPEFFDQLYDIIGPGEPVRILLALLKPGGQIPSHSDAPGITANARIHIPIITTEDVRFTVGIKERHIPQGELCRINNDKPHQVINGSDKNRVHLIVDYKFF